MPFYHGQLLSVSFAETKRYAGLRQKESFPDHLIEEACMEAQILSVPKGIYEVFDYESHSDYGLITAPSPLSLTGKSITNHLAQSTKVALLAVTIGEAIEEEVRSLFAKGRYTAGLLLDAAATTAVESIADQINEEIKRVASRSGFQTTWRFSPGYGDWPVTIQQKLLDTLDTKKINLQATESSMLMPRKSVTAVIGFFPHTDCSTIKAKTERGCQHCSNTSCIARKETN
ncbi:MAG: vitamin B12 dependent-methionine synthase activation domain-containing protein [Sporomusaceae bacterium]|nr:vitamin B12 dependent-methionine synthase activation domain-containing protein [Sporomusaceae bacterium]